MRIVATPSDPKSLAVEWLVVGVPDEADLATGPLGGALGDLLQGLRASGDLTGALGETVPLFGAPVAARSVLTIGLGPERRFDAGAAFQAGVAIAKRLASKPRARVALGLPAGALDQGPGLPILEGLLVGLQSPALRKAEPSRHPFQELLIATPDVDGLDARIERAGVVAGAINQARELVNLPPSEKPPRRLAERIVEQARAAGVEAEVWGPERIAAERFGGLLGVAAGSEEPPAFVRLVYQGPGAEGSPVALVGKGVTFDSGGLSLKPSASMEDMKADMTGAAVVAATITALARLQTPVNVVGYLPLTENMTGGRAMKLGDVLTIRDGSTVEVLNTDAEGRLILADALAYAAEQQPAALIDLATLTGACLVALGTRIAGLFSNDARLQDAIQAACRRTGERAWPLPMDADFDELLRSQVADCKNVGGKWGGAITAARFLHRFVGETPWAHLDIAGPSWSDSDSATRDPGGTGCFVRTLISLLEAGPLPVEGHPHGAGAGR